MFIQHLGAWWKVHFSILADSIEEKVATKPDSLHMWGDPKGWGGGTLLLTGCSINVAFWYTKLFLFLGARVQLQTGERKWSLILHRSRAGLWSQVFCISVEISNFPGAYSVPINNSIPSDFVKGLFSLGCFPSLLLIYQLPSLLSFAWFAPSCRTVSLLLFCGASPFLPFVSICVGWAERTMPLPAGADRLPLVPPNLHLSAGKLQLVAAVAAEWKAIFKMYAAIFLQTRAGWWNPSARKFKRTSRSILLW